MGGNVQYIRKSIKFETVKTGWLQKEGVGGKPLPCWPQPSENSPAAFLVAHFQQCIRIYLFFTITWVYEPDIEVIYKE